MLERLRATLHDVLQSPRGDRLPPLRVGKDALRRLNVTLGYPVASQEELAARATAAQRLRDLQSAPRSSARTKLQAPITVYVEKNRNKRLEDRVAELLSSKSLAFQVLDVTGDEATQTFVTRKAGCALDELPIVFVGDVCLGGYEALVQADLDGSLARAAFPG